MPFTTATLRFLRELARNNRKPWFEAHRAEYEELVKAPMRELIEEMDVRALTDAQAVSARLPALLEADFRLIVPLVRWINGVLGLKAAVRR
jgi:uncharacterized protein (DUF2461 family)